MFSLRFQSTIRPSKWILVKLKMKKLEPTTSKTTKMKTNPKKTKANSTPKTKRRNGSGNGNGRVAVLT